MNIIKNIIEAFLLTLLLSLVSVLTVWGVLLFFFVRFVVNSILIYPLTDGNVVLIMFLVAWLIVGLYKDEAIEFIDVMAKSLDSEKKREKEKNDTDESIYRLAGDGEIEVIVDPEEFDDDEDRLSMIDRQ